MKVWHLSLLCTTEKNKLDDPSKDIYASDNLPLGLVLYYITTIMLEKRGVIPYTHVYGELVGITSHPNWW